MEWTKESVVALIKYWELYPCLFNSKDPMNNNKHARYDALAKIRDALQEKYPEVQIGEIKKKMSYLRGQYSRELLKMKKPNKSDMDADDHYEPQAYWFNLLSFLTPFISCRMDSLCSSTPKVRRNNSYSFKPENESEVALSPKFGSHSPLTPIDNSSMSASNLVDPTVSSLQKVTEAKQNSYPADVEAFGEYIKSKLVGITDAYLKVELENKMLNLICEYTLKQLKKN